MGLVTGLLTLPIAPVRAVVWLAERIDEQARRELYDPESIRRRLAQLEEARDAGELTEQECADIEEELVGRLLAGRAGAGP